MKSIIKKIGKYIASFLGIVLCLILCVSPAFASDDGIYNPADYESGAPVVDEYGVITYSYDFDVPHLYRAYYEDVYVSEGHTDKITMYPPEGTKKITLRTYPLGQYASSNSPWPAGRGVVDVRDFKAFSQFELTAEFELSWSFISPPNGTLEMRSFWNVFCYDESGWYTGTISSVTTSRTWDITNSGTTGGTYYAGGVIQLPENTAYILPVCVNSLYTPGTTESSYFIVRATDLSISFSIESVLENTLTMQVIKDQVVDIDEKLDELLNGTPEQNEQSQETVDKVEQQENDFDAIMEELNDYQEIDLSWGGTVIAEFVASNAYFHFKDLFSPIFNWSPYVGNLMAILAFVNLSVILFGR